MSAGVLADVALDVVVVIPGLARAVPELHEAHAPLEQPARDQRLPAVHMIAVGGAEVLGFLAEVEGIRRLELHAEGQLEGLDARLQPRIAAPRVLVLEIQVAQQIELPPLHRSGRVRAADVLDELLDLAMLRVHEGALKRAGQKTCLPILGILDRHAAGAHGDESRQVLILRARGRRASRRRSSAGPARCRRSSSTSATARGSAPAHTSSG